MWFDFRRQVFGLSYKYASKMSKRFCGIPLSNVFAAELITTMTTTSIITTLSFMPYQRFISTNCGSLILLLYIYKKPAWSSSLLVFLFGCRTIWKQKVPTGHSFFLKFFNISFELSKLLVCESLVVLIPLNSK